MALDLRPLKAVVATLILHAVFLSIYLVKYRGDPSSFVCVGHDRAGAYPYEAVTSPISTAGHDGQFYYALAHRPFAIHAVGFDCAPMRQLRILYPAVCWLGSGGEVRLLFYVMPAVNLLAVAALAWLGAAFALQHGRSAWWGFLLPIALNMGIPLLHDFTDALSTLAIFGLVATWLVGGSWWSIALWGGAALFSREQNLVVVAVIAGAAWRQRRFDVLAGVASMGVLWLTWIAVLWYSYGSPPFLPTQGNLAAPLAGMAFRWTHLGGEVAFSQRKAIINFLSLLQLTLLIPIALYLLTQRMSGVARLIVVAGVALTLVAGESIYEFWNYARVLVWLPLGIWLAAVLTNRHWPAWFLGPAAIRSLVAALGYM